MGQLPGTYDYPICLVSTACHLGGGWWFLSPLAVNGVGCGRRVWELYRRGKYFGCQHCHGLEELAEELTRKVRRLEAEKAAIVRLPDGGTARKPVVSLLPKEGRDERIANYEHYMYSLLISTLHGLERLQAPGRESRLHRQWSRT